MYAFSAMILLPTLRIRHYGNAGNGGKGQTHCANSIIMIKQCNTMSKLNGKLISYFIISNLVI